MKIQSEKERTIEQTDDRAELLELRKAYATSRQKVLGLEEDARRLLALLDVMNLAHDIGENGIFTAVLDWPALTELAGLLADGLFGDLGELISQMHTEEGGARP